METDAGVTYNPLDYDTQDDPYPRYAMLRAQAPVYYNEELDFYALSRHADVAPALRDFTTFSNENGPLMEREFWKADAAKMHSFVAMDPPAHGRWRKLISESFSPRAVRALEPQIQQLAKHYVTEAAERGQFDFMRDIARPIPMDAIGIIIGVAESDRSEVQRLLDRTVHREDGATTIGPEQIRAFKELTEYYASLVAARRERPQADLVSQLVHAEIDDRPVTDEEITGMLHLLGGASTVTTIDLLGNAWYWAWRNPDQQHKALGGEVNGWIEETLRYDSPVQMVIRKVIQPFTLHDTEVPAGAQLLMLMGSANRDGDVFTDPDTFDIARDASKLLSFSGGPHLCVGNLLARRVARTVLSELVHRVADYDIDEDVASRVHRSTVRGFSTLPTYITLR